MPSISQKKLKSVFSGSSDEVRYGSVLQSPYVFQDDVMRLTDSVMSLRTGNVKMDMAAKMMCVKFNKPKTGFTLMGPEEMVQASRTE